MKVNGSDTGKFKIPLGKLAESFSVDEDDQFMDSTGITPFNQNGNNPFHRWVPPHETAEDVTIVAAKAGSEDTNWIYDFCDEYRCTAYLYSLDENPSDDYLTPYSRRGHEASAYLTYIIDNYHRLAPYTIFIHGRTDQWHNDVAGPNTRNVLANLRYEAVSINGYVNLRCTNRPGCPSTMHQAFPVTIDEDYQYMIDQLPQILWDLLRIPPSETPDDIGHQCCAQFAVSRERIQERPLEDYIRILNWIATTDITDNYGLGWLIEKLWHIIFGMPAV
ncbi:uncharacterized protein N7469_000891 [Penicillium citrinum]|uniref:Uncharacterized protein n=2 Tax=Penicillium TaxID=5073 RepID=A0A9W9PFY5_PENCI|nr:uncharacterized protein N7469_000891 [Penicillium citrinum]KAJ5242564.1 hypothetical protein N7469_000891 [Penicillium citrinum]KAJ5599932.1 hypothetical protein N7450_000999 [Penicillium hetheringtonii]